MEKNTNLLDYKNIIPLKTLCEKGELVHYAALEISPKESNATEQQYIFCQFSDSKGLNIAEKFSVYQQIHTHFIAYWAGQDLDIMKKSLDHLISARGIQLILGVNSQSGKLTAKFQTDKKFGNHDFETPVYNDLDVKEILLLISYREHSDDIE